MQNTSRSETPSQLSHLISQVLFLNGKKKVHPKMYQIYSHVGWKAEIALSSAEIVPENLLGIKTYIAVKIR